MYLSFAGIIVAISISFVASEELEYPKVTLKNSWNCKHSDNKTRLSEQIADNTKIAKTWTEDIKTYPENVRFEEIGPEKPGCYKFHTKVSVRKPVQKLWFRTLIKLGDLKSNPLPCTKTDAEIADTAKSCEKGWGSCIWCNGCDKIKQAVGEPSTCPLKVKTYELEQEFCFPKAAEFTSAVPDNVKKVLELTEKGDNTRVVTKDVFIVVQMFDTDIYTPCGRLENPNDCPEEHTRKMKGCVISSATVKMKTISELKLIAAPNRKPGHN